MSVLFVTHKLDECKAIGGQAIIMRDGLKVAECDVATQSKTELGFWMTGKKLDDTRYRVDSHGDETLLSVERLGGAGFDDVSFTVSKGEIFGITGLLDSGRNELALSLAGVEPARRGSVLLAGRRVDLSSPASAIEAGIGYVPEDRLSEGLFLGKSIRENIVMAVLDRLRGALGLLDTAGRRLWHRKRSTICRWRLRISTIPSCPFRAATSRGS